MSAGLAHSKTIHSTAIAIGTSGVLIRGEPGSGKTHLALSLLNWANDRPAERFCALVSDDMTELRVVSDGSNARLIAKAPENIRGLIEMRGVGILKIPFATAMVVTHLVDLQEEPPERLPNKEMQFTHLEGMALPRRVLRAHDPLNPILIRRFTDGDWKDTLT